MFGISKSRNHLLLLRGRAQRRAARGDAHALPSILTPSCCQSAQEIVRYPGLWGCRKARKSLEGACRRLLELNLLVGGLVDFVNNIQAQPVDNPSGTKRAVAGKIVKAISSLHLSEGHNHANA